MTTRKDTSSVDDLMRIVGDANRSVVETFARQFSGDSHNSPAQWAQLIASAMARDSERLQQMQQDYYKQQIELWFRMLQSAPTASTSAQAGTPGASSQVPPDRRFAAPEWRQMPLFDYIRQSYEITSRWLIGLVESLDLDPETRRKALFYTRQYIDAMAPSNFPATNPEVLKLALESNGESIRAGVENLVADLEKGRISMTDEDAFEVGKNIAVSEGAVVHENELFQLIQYRPLTTTVAARPVLFVPPCINKFYIMDLEPDHSLVRYTVAQGHTVFMVSWRNPSEALATITWDDYIERGVIEAIDTVCAITRQEQINLLGFCVGGTLVASALAVLHRKERRPVASLTLMTTLLDFSDVGDIGVYVDPDYVAQRERELADGGLLNGRDLAMAFSSLRPNDLIWHYVVDNYLKGKTPEAFNLLYWNSDSTNLPGPMFVYYLRNLYLENRLKERDALTMCGVPVDLRRIDVPTFVFAAREDHIVPWRAGYAGARTLGGPVEFVLGASGHIAGSINPVSKNKRNYWVDGTFGDDPEVWFASARSVPGSWWPRWSTWLDAFSGKQVAARKRLGNAAHAPIEPAPGRYVREKCTG